MTEVVRWMFTDLDTDEFVFLPINPNEASSATEGRNFQWAWGTRWGLDRLRGVDTPNDSAPEWTFSGVILTEEHDLLLDSWASRDVLLRIDDHLGHAYQVVIQKYDAVEKVPTAQRPFRANYTMTCLLLGEIHDDI